MRTKNPKIKIPFKMNSNTANPPQTYDCIVLGLGCMGITTLYYLAKAMKERGSPAQILGIDQFSVPNTIGSSQGMSRITRQAYYEGEEYIPLIRRSLELIKEIQSEAEQRLFKLTGALFVESTDEPSFIPKIELSAKKHKLDFRMIPHDSLVEEYRYLDLSKHNDRFFGLLEKNAGYINPQKTIKAYLDLIYKRFSSFCSVKENTKIEKISKANGIYKLRDSSGREYNARRIVLASGPWNVDLLREFQGFVDFEASYLRRHLSSKEAKVQNLTKKDSSPSASFLRVQKNQFIFLRYKTPKNQTPKEVLYLKIKDDPHFALYGIPEEAEGGFFKLSLHHFDSAFQTMRDYEKENSKEFIDLVLQYGRKYIRDFEDAEVVDASTCLYTMAPDGNFIVDYIPGEGDQAVVISACSSHGLKCMAAIGEMVSGILNGERKPLEMFRFGRFNRVSKF